MAQIAIFLLLVALAFGLAQCSFDALANYEHERLLREFERTNQIQIHESSLTNRAAIDAAVVGKTVGGLMPLATLQPVPTAPGNGTVVIILVPVATPTPQQIGASQGVL